MDQVQIEQAILDTLKRLSIKMDLDRGGMATQSLRVKLLYQGEGMEEPVEIASDSVMVMELKSILGTW